MPELPEVEVIVRELRTKILDEKVKSIDCYWSKTIVEEDGYSPVSETILAVTRHGKYILIALDSGYIIVHLRMTGQLIVRDNGPGEDRHLRAKINLMSGKEIYFYDSRKFGRICLARSPEKSLRNTGIDALDPAFDWQLLKKFTRGKKTSIKSLLLDQKNVTGLGNIYIDESLFMAGVHPQNAAGKLNTQNIKKIHEAAIQILLRAIEGMGTTISDYKTAGGGFGTFQNVLNVYGRDGESCPRCATKIQKIRIGNRGTHFCPGCQKKKN